LCRPICSPISPVQFYLVKHWKEVIFCLILDIRYLKRLSFRGDSTPNPHQGLCPWILLGAPRSPWAPSPASRCAKLRPCLRLDTRTDLHARRGKCPTALVRGVMSGGGEGPVFTTVVFNSRLPAESAESVYVDC